MHPLSGIQTEFVRLASLVLDTLGWALAIWAAFFVASIWVVRMLTKDRDER
jgi:hypothetical protein